jgi:hypothetical protein
VRALAIAALATFSASMCVPAQAGRVRAEHAREFRCQERWVDVTRQGESPERWQATGCGFLSEWVCRDRECRMRDHRSYGVDSP